MLDRSLLTTELKRLHYNKQITDSEYSELGKMINGSKIARLLAREILNDLRTKDLNNGR